MRARPLGLVLLIAKEKLGLGRKNKGNLNPAHASSFGRCQNCRRDNGIVAAAATGVVWSLRGRELGDGTVTASMSWRASADILG